MSETLYEGDRVHLSRYTGPMNEGKDRRRYQLTLNAPRVDPGKHGTDDLFMQRAWITLTRAELREIVEALHTAEHAELPERSPNVEVQCSEERQTIYHRRFQLYREEDITESSGVGIVAEGVRFHDGTVVMRWMGATRSTGVYANVEDLLHLHGHGNRTKIIWNDEG